MNTNILKKQLMETGYSDNQSTDSTVSRLNFLMGKPHEMLSKWIANREQPDFEAIEGVDSNFLRDNLQMKDPAIIIAYAMLLESPLENAAYFRHLSTNIVGFYPDLEQ